MRKIVAFLIAVAWFSGASAYDLNFRPLETVPLAATTSSSNVAFTLAPAIAANDVIATNNGSNIAFVNCAIGSGVTAAVPGDTVSWPVSPGGAILLNKLAADHCAGITVTGTTTLYFTAGTGN